MRYFIKTYGCQMNEADSERIAGWYEKKGWQKAKSVEQADEIIINSCSVRESAENRAFGLINNLSKLSSKGRSAAGRKIILTGCMLRYPLRTLKEKLPQIDEFRKIERFNSQPARPNSKNEALVPIMEGCNNFCSYCVVPSARGREKSRPFEEIVCEVEGLIKRGYKEITLLGQNVNSYGNDFTKKEIESIRNCINDSNHLNRNTKPFSLLLRKLNQVKGIKKISFMTSNPWDLTNDIIKAISLPKVDRYLHLPIQSGDDEILERMNRKYTAAAYLKLVKKIRQAIPDIKIGTDIIVGFPGETEKQFNNTVLLCRKVGFIKAYVARYSPRPGTAAFKLKDDVTPEEKRKSWRILDNLVNKTVSKE